MCFGVDVRRVNGRAHASHWADCAEKNRRSGRLGRLAVRILCYSGLLGGHLLLLASFASGLQPDDKAVAWSWSFPGFVDS